MSNEASENQDQTTTQTDAGQQSQVADAGASQGQEQQGGEGHAQQESAKQQPPNTIPYERFSEKAREAAELKRQNAQLLQALQGGRQAPKQTADADQDPEPKQEQYSDYNEYIRAQARWDGRQAAKEAYQQERQRDERDRQAREAATTQQQAAQNWFSETAKEDAAFHDDAAKLPLGPLLWHQLMRMKNPAPITKHLIANPMEAQRLSMLPQAEQLVEFGELRAKLAGASGQPPKVTQMPKTITPVGSGKGSGGEEIGLEKALSILYPT